MHRVLLLGGLCLAQTLFASPSPAKDLPLSINIGASPNDKTGDPLRTAFSKTMASVNALYDLRARANGLATLDDAGRIPFDQAPNLVAENGDLRIAPDFAIGRLLAGKYTATPDTLQIKGAGSTGDTSGMSVRRPGGISRTNADRASDALRLKDYGAKLDGSDDTAAYSAARAAAPKNGTVEVPAGQFLSNATPTAGPSTPILWRMSGNTYGDSNVPVIGIGTDVVETFFSGSKYFGQQNSRPNGSPVVRIDSVLNSHNPEGTGFAQNVMNTLSVNMDLPSTEQALGNFGWANSTILTSRAWGNGQHVALAATALRPRDALADGKGPRAILWGEYVQVGDQTNQNANVAGPLVIAEWDMYANGASEGGRIGHHMVFSRDDPTGEVNRVAYGSVVTTNDKFLSPPIAPADYSYLGVGYGVQMGFDKAGFDTSEGTSKNGAPALKMAAGQSIMFDGSATGGFRKLYNLNGQLTYSAQNGPVFQIDDSGGVMAFGPVKTPALNLALLTAPTSSSDPTGSVGDIRLSGNFIYWKTSAGWRRVSGETF